MRYRLVDASPSDEAWLDDLRRRAYVDLFDTTWGGWDEDRHRRHFAACLKRGHISIVEVDGTRVGMCQVLDHGDAVEVAELQIDPTHQARGIGTAVLLDVVSDARERGLPVHLSVGSKNQKAIQLYRRLGFRAGAGVRDPPPHEACRTRMTVESQGRFGRRAEVF